MSKKLIFLTSFVLVLALAGTNVALGDVWEARITQDSDDNEELDPSGTPEGGSSDLEMPYEDAGQGDKQIVGLRWENVGVPKGATIIDAWIEFVVDEIEADLHVSVIIEGELNPNPPTWTTSTVGEIAARQPRTIAQAIWEPEHWATVGEKKRTSDISPVIEEIVGQAGWVEGNALVLIIRDNPANPSLGNRTGEAGPGDDAVLLHIEYTLGNAMAPRPADGAIDVPRDVVLSWTPGVFTAPVNGHKLYFSENFNDVNDGIGGITQSESSYTPPQRLDFSTTYYWRVDENSGPPDNLLFEGDIWSFTTELFAYPIENITATASSVHQADMGPENTINGSGMDANDLHSTEETAMWLSSAEPLGAWIGYEFDKVYKLHEMLVWNSNQMIEPLVGFGARDVTVEHSTNGTDYTTLGTTHEFARAPGANGYAHNTTIDFGGTAAKYVRLTATSGWGGIMPQYGISEVRFLHIPVSARNPYPDSGATGVDVDVTLGWNAGREAVTHDVYLSTDEQAVIDGTAPVATVTEISYGPLALDLDVTHYWKVNEVNEAETPTTWESAIWSFATTDHLIVDDFESYNDLDPADPASKRIFNVWIDGFEVPTNGSLVGYESPPFCEQTIVNGGMQSMPFFYSNTGGAASSEAELTLTPAQDWTVSGVKTLVVHFHGADGNTGQLYVKINGSKVTYDGDATNLARTWWHLWNIDLASVGTNLQNVTSLSIGIDGNGASGTLYFDDIELYALAPAPPAPVNEWRIATGSDDAEEHIPAGGVDLGSSDLELGHEGTMSPTSLQTIGCRWVALPIPKGATITEAWVQFSADDINNDYHIPDVSLIIEGELSPSPATFSSTASNISSRPKTTAQVVWDIPQWMTEHAKGPEERTTDISSIVQEIVNQDGWAGNAIVLMFRDNPAKPSQGTREAEAFDGSAIEAPLLHISYQ
ncbi:MAG: discoidin domain-containing protein [Planctomycetota bacterium]